MLETIRNRNLTVPLGLALCLVVVLMIWLGVRSAACAVMLDSKEVGRVHSKKEAQKVIVDIKKQNQGKVGNIEGRISTRTVLSSQKKILTPAKLQERLESELGLKVPAVWIAVNGKKLVAVRDRAAADDVIEKIKADGAALSSGEKIVSLRIEEKVSQVAGLADADKVLPVKEAVTALETGSEEPITYEVKEGDNLWLIARRHDTHVADIMRINGITGEHLDLGQKLLIPTSKPYVNVVAEICGSRVEKIPYETQVTTSTRLSPRKVVVKREGQEGQKSVAYTMVKQNGRVVSYKTIEEKVLKKPVDKIVLKGPRASYQVASRGFLDVIAGKGWIWPLKGHITSGFGGSRHHTGTDIDGTTGEAIRAAKGGTVVFAGYSGGYGYNVVISHGDGFKTRYAHCSKLYVKTGDKVSQGEVIAAVGSTGHSTGSHLHFEIIKDGGFINPLSALR